MKIPDLAWLVGASVRSTPTRSLLSGLGIAIGILAVTLLTALGEGLRQYILDEFTQFGTNLIAVNPGKTSTLGMPGGVVNSIRPLTLADADALVNIAGVDAAMPMIQGNAEVESGKRGRRANVFGVNHAMPVVFRIGLEKGKFLPADDPRNPRAYAVLGHKMARELFPDGSAIGELVRIGGNRFRVIGVAEAKGVMLGFDLDDTAYLPAALAQELFNREGLMEIDLHYREGYSAESIVRRTKAILIARHGSEDFTVTTQDQMLEVLDTVLDVVTWSIAALGGISLFVGAIGILTIMTIAVQERIGEIGLLRAIGASKGQISSLFLGEAAWLACLGGTAGLSLALGLVFIGRQLVPGFPFSVSWVFVMASFLTSGVIGVIAGVAPALQASRINPIQALRNE